MQLPPTHPVRSNVFYHFWLSIAQAWNFIGTCILVVIFALKHYNFPMTKSAADWCMISPFFWFVLNLIKISVGKMGNKSEHVIVMAIAIILGIVCVIMEIYFLAWQPYLWCWESPLHYVSLVIDGVMVVFSIVLVVLFAIN